MTAYENHLYNYLTKPENFEPFFDLKEQYESVRRRLIDDFWADVHTHAMALKPSGSAWKYELDAPRSQNRKLRAKHPAISDHNFNAGIVYEFLEAEVILGVWFDRRVYNDHSMTKAWADGAIYLSEHATLRDDHTWKIAGGGWWFTIYKKPGLNLTQKTSLIDILPDKKESLARFYAEQLVYAVEHLGDFCLAHAKKP